ncbi:MAG: N-formylglutamate deformylase [Kangiellaceae bacterium]|nr:N-formylglutamate deformylase [Kangiellaceae bacterium]
MNELSYTFCTGEKPILISMPHNGISIPGYIKNSFTSSALKLVDTDWFMDKLYQFAVEQGCYLISPKFSRYVIDLNRPKNNKNLYPGQDTTSLCPINQFDHQPIYKPGKEPSPIEIQRRVDLYWEPYHSKLQLTLNQLKEKFGTVLLFEAHSIKSQVPRFFEGQLPDFNFGDFNHESCAKELSDSVDNWSLTGYSKVLNGRFKGGYITREYGNPEQGVHALQLELSQATYLNESTLEYDTQKAFKVSRGLEHMFELFYAFVNK